MTSWMVTLALLAAADPPDWFRAWQYAAKPTSLRGCSECQGEPDDLCEIRAGVQARALADYSRQRSPQKDRVKLLRSKADPDCAVLATAFFGSRGAVELAAIRMSLAPPSAALIEKLGVRYSVAGWPHAPRRRKGAQPVAGTPDRATLRTALVCWGSETGWPAAELGNGTSCEWWLLPVTVDNEPDLARASFPLVAQKDHWPEPFRFGDPRWGRAFDRTAALDESILVGGEPPHPEPAAAAPPPSTPPPATERSPARCSGDAQARAAVLDRFEQWEAQVVGARRSLDRATWTLDSAAWSGHCQELDVLRSALEQHLGCVLGLEGRCVGPGGDQPR